MRIPRIYQDCELAKGYIIELDARASKHLLQVLRFETGREIVVFNGSGGEFRAQLTEVKKRSASVEILEQRIIERESPVNIHLAQCISKGDRFEFAIQKSVEMGVKEISPIFSTRSQLKLNHERRDKKLQHWRQIALSACEQSGRTRIVKINEPVALADFFKQQKQNSACQLILHPQSESKLSSLSLNGSYTLLVGPEGGFEEQELELAKTSNFNRIQLGAQVLRTETAPIAAMAAIYALEKIY